RTLNELLKRIASSGAKIALVEVPAGILTNPFAGVFQDAANRYGAILIPESWLRFRFMVELLIKDHLKKPMTIDGIHLSPHGARLVADWLKPYIRQILGSKV